MKIKRGGAGRQVWVRPIHESPVVIASEVKQSPVTPCQMNDGIAVSLRSSQ
jgi:hypothetical protein